MDLTDKNTNDRPNTFRGWGERLGKCMLAETQARGGDWSDIWTVMTPEEREEFMRGVMIGLYGVQADSPPLPERYEDD